VTRSVPIHRSTSRSYMFLGVRMTILLSNEQTGGNFTLIEGVMEPGGDGGLHVHRNEDESMHLLEGSLQVTIGNETFTLMPGESYFAPRNIPHRLKNLGDVPARALLITTPGSFDEFIARAGIPIIGEKYFPSSEPPTPNQIQELIPLAGEFGIEILVPPDPHP
jgi:mannose-6-phosphate isomerase-like protein (cupin superfamily)